MASRYWHKNIVTRRSSMVDPYVRMAAAVLVPVPPRLHLLQLQPQAPQAWAKRSPQQ